MHLLNWKHLTNGCSEFNSHSLALRRLYRFFSLNLFICLLGWFDWMRTVESVVLFAIALCVKFESIKSQLSDKPIVSTNRTLPFDTFASKKWCEALRKLWQAFLQHFSARVFSGRSGLRILFPVSHFVIENIWIVISWFETRRQIGVSARGKVIEINLDFSALCFICLCKTLITVTSHCTAAECTKCWKESM